MSRPEIEPCRNERSLNRNCSYPWLVWRPACWQIQGMKMTLTSAVACIALVVPPISSGGEELSELRKQADSIRATAAETNYVKIPWVTDLFEGFRLAKEEKRPVFLYMITGDPLADC